MGNNHLLFEQLFKGDVSATDTAGFLAGVTSEYPYFTAAQFFLLQKTAAQDDSYKEQAAKTAILFNNPLWLNFQLNESAGSTFSLKEREVQEVISDEKNDDKVSATAEPDFALSEITVAESPEEIIIPAIKIPEEKLIETVPVEPLLLEEENQPVAEENAVFSLTDTQQENLIEIVPEEIFLLEEENEPVIEEETLPVAESGITENIQAEIEPAKEMQTPFFIEDRTANDAGDNGGYSEEDEEEFTEDNEIEPMHIKLNFTPDMSTTEETISFEPLHTSDYFASLGIKFSDETKPGDKLGKQLKSFTEWLKTMKKIHADHLPQQTAEADIVIQKMAEKSNTESEVVTEAMAEVLLQQNKAVKAIEVYQKLSLLNPSKSAYFAAKIGQIER